MPWWIMPWWAWVLVTVWGTSTIVCVLLLAAASSGKREDEAMEEYFAELRRR